MRSTLLCLGLVALVQATALPGRYLAVFSSDVHDEFHALARRGIAYDVRHVYRDDDLLHGVSIQLDNDEDASRLAALPHVKRLVPVTRHTRNEKSAIKVVKGDPAKLQRDIFPTHTMTRIAELHAKGILGKGAAVCVIDDGVDYTHPALGGCFGKGCKVDRGYDFVGNGPDPVQSPKPLPCPTGEDAGHGTHCAGIVGAQDKLIGFTGAAPLASLGAYRIMGCDGTYDLDVAIAAILRAVRDKCDVLSMSFGEPGGWSQELLAQTVSNAVLKSGKTVAISMGNSAREGLWYAQTPQAGRGVIGVGSIDVEKVQGWRASTSTGRVVNYMAPINFEAGVAKPVITLAQSYDDPAAKNCVFPFATTLVEGAVVVVNGDCAAEVQTALKKRQATKYTTLWTQTNNLPPQNVLTANFAGVISIEDGRYLYEQAAKANITMTFTTKQVLIDNSLSGGFMSPFSTYGPTWSMDSPSTSISAPGGEVLSTWPVASGSYAILSGTSMSTPLIAGIAGLYISAQKRGQKVNPLVLRDILESTARPLNLLHANGLDTVVHQGNGEVDAFCALTSSVLASPGQILLGDAKHAKMTQRITLKNTGRRAVTYAVKHRPAMTALTHTNDSTSYPIPPPLRNAPASVKVASKIRIPAGKTVSLDVEICAPKLPASQYAVYSGFIELTSHGLCPLSVAYTGVASDLSTLTQIGKPGLYDGSDNLVNSTRTFTMKPGDQPRIQYIQAAGTAILSIDLVPSNTTAKTLVRRDYEHEVAPVHALVDSVTSNSTLARRAAVVDPAVAIAQRSLARAFPHIRSLASITLQTYVPRSAATDGVTTSFALPSSITDGDYRVLIRELKLYGDANRATGYATFLSVPFVIKR